MVTTKNQTSTTQAASNPEGTSRTGQRSGIFSSSGKPSTSSSGDALVDPQTFDIAPDLSTMTEWTDAEQSILDTEIAKYPLEKYTPLQRYVQVAAKLENKTVRDVALRVSFAKKDKAGKKRKALAEEQGGTKKPKGEKREPRSQSIFSVGIGDVLTSGVSAAGMGQPMGGPQSSMGPPQQGGPHPAMQGGMPAMGGPSKHQPLTPMSCAAQIPVLEDHGASTSGGLGGPTTQFLEQNIAVIKQIRDNWQQCRIHDNADLLCTFRDNLLKIMNTMAGMSGIMNQMPNLPVKLNVELATQLLPPPQTN